MALIKFYRGKNANLFNSNEALALFPKQAEENGLIKTIFYSSQNIYLTTISSDTLNRYFCQIDFYEAEKDFPQLISFLKKDYELIINSPYVIIANKLKSKVMDNPLILFLNTP